MRVGSGTSEWHARRRREYDERSGDERANVLPSWVEAITDAMTAAGEPLVDSVRQHQEQVRAGHTDRETLMVTCCSCDILRPDRSDNH